MIFNLILCITLFLCKITFIISCLKLLLSIEAQFRHIKLLFKYQNISLMFDVTSISSITITITRTRILMFAFYYSSLYNSIKDTFLIFVLETNKTITNDANPMPIHSG